MQNSQNITLRQAALLALTCETIEEKCSAVLALDLNGPVGALERLVPVLGRPSRPVLVGAREVPARSVTEVLGRGMLLHALAHIEFNAINLALDLVVRFPNQPDAFYTDWVQVAKEEAFHHALLCERLGAYGLVYGDYPAHDGLWQVAQKTQDSLMARLALVPRLLEARGLDVSPSIRDKLHAAGDSESAAVLEVILRDEIGHVRIGNLWFHALCEQAGVSPMDAFEQCLLRYNTPKPRAPFNYPAREQAGFSAEELAWLHQLEFEQMKSRINKEKAV